MARFSHSIDCANVVLASTFAMATLAAVAARPWRLLICGLRHGRPVESLKRLLEELARVIDGHLRLQG